MPLKINPDSGLLDLVGTAGAGAGQTDLTGDVGAAVTPDGSDSISLIGDATQAYIETTGTPASNKMEIKLAKPAIDGQLLIGHTANAEPSVATLTAGSGITITNAAGAITVASTATSSLNVTTDTTDANAVAGSLGIVGGTGVDTTGSGSTVTINASAAVPTTFTTDTTSATPAGNSLAVSGGTGINTSGAGAAITVNLDDPVIAAQGGSGRQSHTAYAVIAGGTTTTAAQQSIASVGTSGQLLTSNGAGALPSMEDGPAPESLTTALTAGSVVFSDGTNLTEDNANFFYDDTNNRLGIGTTTPLDDLHVVGSIELDHTAAEDDDHALEIACDAAGFADVKAVDIVYTTGAIVAGDDEEAILVNIDESASVGGEVSGYEIIATAEGSATIHGYTTGININPILHNSGTFGDIDDILNKAVDVTAALASGGAGSISVFVADNDTVTYGDAAEWNEMEFIVGTPASGSGISPTWEFSTGGAGFTAFSPSDGTNGLRNSGAVLWIAADLVGWATNASGLFEVRHTRTRNTVTTTPILDEVQLSSTTEYIWNKDGDVEVKSIDIDTGQAFKINAVDTLNATTLGSAVLASSLTSVGTIATGVWEATDVGVVHGGTGRSTGGVAYAPLLAGTTATGAHQSPASAGTVGQVFTSAGASSVPTWETVASGSGSWIPLVAQTASASATVEFTTNIDSTYSMYALVITAMQPATTNFKMRIKVSTDTGSTYEGTSYLNYSIASGSHSTTDAVEVPEGMRTDASGKIVDGIIWISNPASATSFTKFRYELDSPATASSAAVTVGGGYRSVQEVVDAIEISMSSGNITAGLFELYGIKHV